MDICTPTIKYQKRHVYHLLLSSLVMAGTWLSSISWLRMSKNTLPDKEFRFRNLVCGNLLMIGNITALSKPGLGWKITTLTEPWSLLPESTEGLRAGEEIR